MMGGAERLMEMPVEAKIQQAESEQAEVANEDFAAVLMMYAEFQPEKPNGERAAAEGVEVKEESVVHETEDSEGLSDAVKGSVKSAPVVSEAKKVKPAEEAVATSKDKRESPKKEAISTVLRWQKTEGIDLSKAVSLVKLNSDAGVFLREGAAVESMPQSEVLTSQWIGGVSESQAPVPFAPENLPVQTLVEQGASVSLLSLVAEGSPASRKNRSASGEELSAVNALEPTRGGSTAGTASTAQKSAPLTGASDRVDDLKVLLERVERRVTTMVEQGRSTMKLSFESDTLGSLSLRCRNENGRYLIEIHTQNPVIQEQLQRHEGAIRSLFEGNGSVLDGFDVTCGDDRGNSRAWDEASGDDGAERKTERGIGSASSNDEDVSTAQRSHRGSLSVVA